MTQAFSPNLGCQNVPTERASTLLEEAAFVDLRTHRQLETVGRVRSQYVLVYAHWHGTDAIGYGAVGGADPSPTDLVRVAVLVFGYGAGRGSVVYHGVRLSSSMTSPWLTRM